MQPIGLCHSKLGADIIYLIILILAVPTSAYLPSVHQSTANCVSWADSKVEKNRLGQNPANTTLVLSWVGIERRWG